MQKGVNVLVSDYRFYEDSDDFSFLLTVFCSGVVFRQRFYWFDDEVFIKVRPPYYQPAQFGSLVIDNYDIMSSIVQQLDVYRKRFETDLFNSISRKHGI